MIRDQAKRQAWEDSYIASQPANDQANVRLLDAMLAEAQALGHWPGGDLPADLSTTIALARAVNVRIPDQKNRPDA